MIKKKLLILTAAVAAVSLITVISIMGSKIKRLSDNLSDNQLLYNQELDNSKLLIDEISQNIQIMSAGNNEIRRSLHMPLKQLIQKKTEEIEVESIDPAVSFFDALNFLIRMKILKRLRPFFLIL